MPTSKFEALRKYWNFWRVTGSFLIFQFKRTLKKMFSAYESAVQKKSYLQNLLKLKIKKLPIIQKMSKTNSASNKSSIYYLLATLTTCTDILLTPSKSRRRVFRKCSPASLFAAGIFKDIFAAGIHSAPVETFSPPTEMVVLKKVTPLSLFGVSFSGKF